jgi:hypothetical protein
MANVPYMAYNICTLYKYRLALMRVSDYFNRRKWPPLVSCVTCMAFILPFFILRPYRPIKRALHTACIYVLYIARYMVGGYPNHVSWVLSLENTELRSLALACAWSRGIKASLTVLAPLRIIWNVASELVCSSSHRSIGERIRGVCSVIFCGCPNIEIRWPFLFNGLRLRTCSYFGADSTT